jgi:hydroxyethylthiazole kinase-like uncharacterized protein yjeF
MKYVSVAQMVRIEREADASGLTYDRMMENAGRGLAEALQDQYGYLEEQGILGLVGSGNNGGDTLVALAYLAKEGWKASAYIVRPRPAEDPLIARLMEAGGAVYPAEDDPKQRRLASLLGEHGLLLDGILGTGIHLPLKPNLAEFMGTVKEMLRDMTNPPVVVAVDCPSGVDCDSGAAAPECLRADTTVTMAAYKQGLFKFPAYGLAGEICLVGIGLPEDGEALKAWQEVKSFVVNGDWVRSALPARPLDAHKGTFGTALVVSGSVNYTGAAWLAGQAAYRIGAGLVTLAVPAPLHAALAGQFPEATWLPLPEEGGAIASGAEQLIHDNLERVTGILIGPGFGLAKATGRFLSGLLQGTRLPPLAIDADGLKLLAQIPGWPQLLPTESVLTPHPGEMAALTGLSTGEIQGDRLDVALKYSREWGHVVVLKGAFTVIAAPDGQAAIIPVATPALARAGTGDVLAGLIVGLIAQGTSAFQAACCGAWIHAYAGLSAAQALGNAASVLAGDVLRATIDVISDLA